MKSYAHLLHIVLNSFTNDSRVEKEIASLSNMGNSVTLFALHENMLPVEERKAFGTLLRFRLTSRSWPKNKLIQLFKYLECLIRMAYKGILLKPKCVHAHDLNALPIGFIVSKTLGVPLIYDAHEFETEQTQNPNRLIHSLSVRLEHFLIRRADAVINVSSGIADAYVKRYGIDRPHLVLNCPPYQEMTKQNLFRTKLGIRADQKIFLYQGALFKERGIEQLLESFEKSDRRDIVLVFMGYGELVNDITSVASRSDNIFYHPAVSRSELLSYTASADVGLCLIENTCLSYYYCLPNKVFEYAMVGLPMLVSNLAEIGRLVREYDCGQVIEDDSPDGIRAAIDHMLTSGLERYAANSRALARHYNWEEQEKVLLSVYKDVMSCAE